VQEKRGSGESDLIHEAGARGRPQYAPGATAQLSGLDRSEKAAVVRVFGVVAKNKVVLAAFDLAAPGEVSKRIIFERLQSFGGMNFDAIHVKPIFFNADFLAGQADNALGDGSAFSVV